MRGSTGAAADRLVVGRRALPGRGCAMTSRAGHGPVGRATGQLVRARKDQAADGRRTRTHAGRRARGIAIVRRASDAMTLTRRGAVVMPTVATWRGRRARTVGGRGARIRAARGLAGRPIVRHEGGRRARTVGGRGATIRVGHVVSATAIGRRVSGSTTQAHPEIGARATAATRCGRRMPRDRVLVMGATAGRKLRRAAIADRAAMSRAGLGLAVRGLVRRGTVRPGMVGHRVPGGLAVQGQADSGSARLTRLAGCRGSGRDLGRPA